MVGKLAADKARKFARDRAEKAARDAGTELEQKIVKNPAAQEQMMNMLDLLYRKAMDGIPHVSRSVDELVADYSSKNSSNRKAARALVKNQLLKCTTAGFLTSLGGAITLPIAVSADMTSVIYIQLRMIAAIAELAGYDPRIDQVQTFVFACLTGNTVNDLLKNAGINAGKKMAVNVIERIPGEVCTRINRAVGFRMITKFGETGVINLGKALPFVGGVIGGGFDYASTKAIAETAERLFFADDSDLAEISANPEDKEV